MISVLIATKNRSTEIIPCVRSILNNSHKSFEILVVDQSATDDVGRKLRMLRDKRIRYLRHLSGGKTSALNSGLRVARGDLVAFTDDDCVADRSWLRTISRTFTKHPAVSMLFGKTLPLEPDKHPKETCPSTTERLARKLVTAPGFHGTLLGFGNNMAIRSSVLRKVGGFKTWLGPGSIGSNAEDAEIALRLLTHHQQILTEPDMVVYHNRWLSKRDMFRQHLSYITGEMACYTFYLLHGHIFAKSVVADNWNDSIDKTGRLIGRRNHQQTKTSRASMIQIAAEWVARIRGYVVGLIFGTIAKNA